VKEANTTFIERKVPSFVSCGNTFAVIDFDAMQEFSTVPAKKGIYLDHNATTPVSTEVAYRVSEVVSSWGNPSSIHQFGRGPKAVIREARRALASGLGCNDLELIFTSGGSESNTSVIESIWKAEQVKPEAERRLRMICSAVEHPAVYEAMEALARFGCDVVKVPVSKSGVLDLVFLEEALKEKPTSLVSIMFANNETGSLFPVEKACQLAHEHGAFFHSDMVQALGKVPVDLHALNFDFASFSAHKFYSIKGCGIIYSKKGRQLESLIKGGSQERSRRAGTENTLAIAALGVMAKRLPEVAVRADQMKDLRDHMEAELGSRIEGFSVTGDGVRRLPGSMSAIIPGVDGETLLMNLDMKGFAVSTGAACSSGSPEPSPTLLAMGLTRQQAQNSLRVGLGWTTSKAEVGQFIDALVKTVVKLRSFEHGAGQQKLG